MKTVHLYDAVFFLRQCSGVLLEGRFVSPTVYEIQDEASNEFLVLEWEEIHDEELVVISVGFREGDNQSVELDGSILVLINSEGEEEELVLLKEWFPHTK